MFNLLTSFLPKPAWIFHPRETRSWDEFVDYLDTTMRPYEGVAEIIYPVTNEDDNFRRAYFTDLIDKALCQTAYQRAVFAREAKYWGKYDQMRRDNYLHNYDVVGEVWRRKSASRFLMIVSSHRADPMWTTDEHDRQEAIDLTQIPGFGYRYIEHISHRYSNLAFGGDRVNEHEFFEQFRMLTMQDVQDLHMVMRRHTNYDFTRLLEERFKRSRPVYSRSDSPGWWER